jgi:hypothetical protein
LKLSQLAWRRNSSTWRRTSIFLNHSWSKPWKKLTKVFPVPNPDTQREQFQRCGRVVSRRNLLKEFKLFVSSALTGLPKFVPPRSELEFSSRRFGASCKVHSVWLFQMMLNQMRFGLIWQWSNLQQKRSCCFKRWTRSYLDNVFDFVQKQSNLGPSLKHCLTWFISPAGERIVPFWPFIANHSKVRCWGECWFDSAHSLSIFEDFQNIFFPRLGLIFSSKRCAKKKNARFVEGIAESILKAGHWCDESVVDCEWALMLSWCWTTRLCG